mmetsp:Transcript_22993/g.52133  ORF Transcript_22993/g.52133 Transcript_22993/m.52133 type:complete len:89 (+) Transcript_22993:366-632(+)
MSLLGLSTMTKLLNRACEQLKLSRRRTVPYSSLGRNMAVMSTRLLGGVTRLRLAAGPRPGAPPELSRRGWAQHLACGSTKTNDDEEAQ